MEKTRKLLHCPSFLSSRLPTSVCFDCVTNYHIMFYYVTHHTVLDGLNNRNVFIHCSGSQKSKISIKSSPTSRGQQGHSVWRLWEGILALLLPTFGGCLPSPGTQWHHSSLCLCGPMASPPLPCGSSLLLSLSCKNIYNCMQALPR